MYDRFLHSFHAVVFNDLWKKTILIPGVIEHEYYTSAIVLFTTILVQHWKVQQYLIQ